MNYQVVVSILISFFIMMMSPSIRASKDKCEQFLSIKSVSFYELILESNLTSGDQKREALKALTGIHSLQSLNAIIRALKVPEVASAAAHYLLLRSVKPLLPILIEHARNPHTGIRSALPVYLKMLDGQVVDDLILIAKNENSRAEALFLMGHIKSQASMTYSVFCLTDPNQFVRQEASNNILRWAPILPQKMIDALVRNFTDLFSYAEHFSEVISEMQSLFVQLDYVVYSDVFALVTNGNPKIRVAAIKILTQMNLPHLLAFWAGFLQQDAHQDVRVAVVEAILSITNKDREKLRPLLMDFINGTDTAEVREAISEIINQYKFASDVVFSERYQLERLVSGLMSDNPMIRLRVEEVIKVQLINGKNHNEIIRSLMEFIDDYADIKGKGDARERAFYILADITTPEVENFIFGLMSDRGLGSMARHQIAIWGQAKVLRVLEKLEKALLLEAMDVRVIEDVFQILSQMLVFAVMDPPIQELMGEMVAKHGHVILQLHYNKGVNDAPEPAGQLLSMIEDFRRTLAKIEQQNENEAEAKADE